MCDPQDRRRLRSRVLVRARLETGAVASAALSPKQTLSRVPAFCENSLKLVVCLIKRMISLIESRVSIARPGKGEIRGNLKIAAAND